jgi:hypothetical protein
MPALLPLSKKLFAPSPVKLKHPAPKVNLSFLLGARYSKLTPAFGVMVKKSGELLTLGLTKGILLM